MASISLKNILKVYPGGVKAVQDFNLEIKDKEFCVFVGPSGCGKSTTLRMIAGLEDITSGDLFIDDRRVNNVDAKDRDIAMVFQNYALYPYLTVFENMAFGLKLRKVPKKEIEQKVHAAADTLGLEQYLERKPKNLSGGQRQRVALGRAIVREPKVFLLDEPLSNLDAKMRAQMRTEIIRLHDRLQTTFVYVTHDQTEAMTMGTRIVVMKDGFIQQVDTPDNLYDYPVNKFVGGFIGTPQMNFIMVELLDEDGKVYATFGRNKLLVPKEVVKRFVGDEFNKRQFFMGIRAEDISIAADTNTSGDDTLAEPPKKGVKTSIKATSTKKTAVKGEVRVREKLGNEILVYCQIDGVTHDIVARVPGRTSVNPKDQLDLRIDMNFIHLFDYESEMTFLKR